MNWHIFLPGFFFLLIVLIRLGAKRFHSLIPLHRQSRLLFLLLFISLIMFLLETPPIRDLADFGKTLHVIGLVLIFSIMVLGIRLIRIVVFDWLIGRRASERRLKVVEDLAGLILYLIGTLVFADRLLNIHVTPILATSAVITIVAGFALQNILGDLFAGLALNFDESLHIGDWIELGTVEGRIEQLRWRSMKIRTRDGFLALIPNQKASKENVIVQGNSKSQTAVRLSIGVSYDNEPDQVMEIVRQKIAQLDAVVADAPVDIWISAFDDCAVIYTIRFRITDPALRDRTAGALRHHLWYAFKRRGVTIPYPIRTVINTGVKAAPDEHRFITQLLQQNEILAQLPPDRLERIATVGELLLFGRNEQIIREEEEGRAFHIIVSGQVEVCRKGQRITTLSAGNYFGEMALLTGEKTSATVIALSECRLLRIAARDFKDMIAMNEQSAQAISEVIARRRAHNIEQDEEWSKKKKGLIRSDSESIFQRIKRYFELSGFEEDKTNPEFLIGEPRNQR